MEKNLKEIFGDAMSKFICAIGISGCGKTTFGNFLKEENPNLVIICPDDIREGKKKAKNKIKAFWKKT